MSTWRTKPGQPFEALQVAPDTVTVDTRPVAYVGLEE